eukprot:jgi/Chrzof1/8191/Cz03g00310.t1
MALKSVTTLLLTWLVMVVKQDTIQAAAMPHRCGHSISGVQQRQQTLLSEFQEKMYAQDAKESFKVSRQAVLNRLLNTTKSGPFRITPIYQLQDSDFLRGLPADKAAVASSMITKVLIPSSIAILQKFLRVRLPTQGQLHTSLKAGAACGAATIDSKLAATGTGYASTDYLLYVTSTIAKDCPPIAYAWAQSCDYDIITLRPLVGAINICPLSLVGGEPVETTVATLVHEIIHALGFSNHLYDLFYDGKTGKPHPKPLVGSQRQRIFLTTPKVRAVARQHFSCELLPGAPLEDELGAPYSHWEQSLMNHELMQPGNNEDAQRQRITAFTLALLEDSGWYVPKDNLAQMLEWGAQEGCEFVYKHCRQFMKQAPRQQYFCKEQKSQTTGTLPTKEVTCSFDSRAVGVCTNADEAFYTNNCHLELSPDSIPVLCSNGKIWDKSTSAQMSTLGGKVGTPTSRCFDLVRGVACVAPATAGGEPVCSHDTYLCATAKCNAAGQVFMVVTKGNGQSISVVCDTDTIDLATAVPGHFINGTVACPPKSICATLSCGPCDKGYCWKGKCYCFMEATGANCSTSVIPKLPTATLVGFDDYHAARQQNSILPVPTTAGDPVP